MKQILSLFMFGIGGLFFLVFFTTLKPTVVTTASPLILPSPLTRARGWPGSGPPVVTGWLPTRGGRAKPASGPHGGLSPPILCQLSWRTPSWVNLGSGRSHSIIESARAST
jgi:hypothetical protein